MNKPSQNQLPLEDQPMAEKLTAAAKAMPISPAFQSQLQSELMNVYATKNQPSKNWFPKFAAMIGWAAAGLAGIIFLSWAIRSLIPGPTPAQEISPTPEVTFENAVQNGSTCTAPLALAHGFNVYLTYPTGSLSLDAQKAIGELRSFAWSPDGKRLAIVGNTTGNGNIYLADLASQSLQPVIPNSKLGYLMDVAWSHDGKRFLTWEIRDNTAVFLVNQDGTGLEEIKLGAQLIGPPQFTPDNAHIIFYGASSSGDGLLEFGLADQQIRVISSLLADGSSFVWSPDGARLAYMEMDRAQGEARLVAETFTTGDKLTLATFPISKGSGAALPSSANLSWSPDGTQVLFEYGRGVTERSVYLAFADGSGLITLAEQAYAPTLSEDGCLAFIRKKQVFLMDLTRVPGTPDTPALLLADLPAGRAVADFRMDKLQWGSISTP